jgi:hypothetical protein
VVVLVDNDAVPSAEAVEAVVVPVVRAHDVVAAAGVDEMPPSR